MRLTNIAFIIVTACGTSEVTEAVEISSPPPVIDDDASAPEPVAIEPVVETAPTIDVNEMLRSIRLGRRVTSSARLLRLQITPVQRAPHTHSAPVVRSWSESRIIAADPTIESPHELLELTMLVLARIAISEAGWEFEADMPAIYQVIRRNRGSDETLINAMRNHSRIVSEVWQPLRDRERWLTELNLDLTRPEHFPTDLDQRTWDFRYRDRWAAALQLARNLLDGRVAPPCPVQVTAWGGRCSDPEGACDDHRAERYGLVPVETCGNTHNRFWTQPRLMTPEVAREEVALAAQRGVEPYAAVVAIASGS